ncbi:malonyl-[acyl-carrier protein] O-methyltransferase [Variibacter gotjawalensis]|uniref:Malonyl-[acyl-carrier protein] O-methyltransferase n=1 Tax=Variibacter gotjawalensis TaxID=1333996 RepID=A0A0S3PST1_9BRAD|nr:methyltransferase domain-containing protein [Variibacter gotjawalensis]NIK49301.1 SAM-dependent methyltransferase [Variibacter gotjawalensis]RZS51152.1 methyltransferase family protein [Variibacter gotjawalensis]BAT58987.1 malonyl-[acyl-carrier protein] O-methyltransferase [Variibacter gotjawalensis]
MTTPMDTAPQIFDRALIARRQRRALRDPATFLLDRVVDELADRLSVILREFPVAVDLATPGGRLAPLLAARRGATQTITTGAGGELVADAEALPFAEASLDLIVSALALQFVNDLPGTLAQARRALRPDGLFLAALLGGDTLTELRQSFAEAETELTGGVSPRVAPFADVRTLGMLLQRAGFALPVTDVDRVTVRYETPFALLHDLRRMGATNPLTERRRVPLRRGVLLRMAEIYKQRFAGADGRVMATFDIVWLTGWAPHASQQQPLRPGSAKTRLADALRTTERPAGEKAG